MLLLDASTIAKNVGRRLLFAGSRRAARSHSDLGGCADGTTSVADSKTLFLACVCLGLDCHEFSSKPSHTNAWSTRFLPGHMFPVKAQTITAVARVLKRCERARLRLEAPSATRCVPRGGWASCNSNPLVDVRTGARHADGR